MTGNVPVAGAQSGSRTPAGDGNFTFEVSSAELELPSFSFDQLLAQQCAAYDRQVTVEMCNALGEVHEAADGSVWLLAGGTEDGARRGWLMWR